MEVEEPSPRKIEIGEMGSRWIRGGRRGSIETWVCEDGISRNLGYADSISWYVVKACREGAWLDETNGIGGKMDVVYIMRGLGDSPLPR